MPEDLEKIMEKKESLSKRIAETMKKFLGVKVDEINEDISSKVMRPELKIPVNMEMKYKKSKEEFKKRYLIQLLQQVNGNVSKAAEISGLDRRSLHRLIKKYKIKIKEVRKIHYTAEDQKVEYVYNVVEEALSKYDLTKQKKEELKKEDVKDISSEMPEIRISFKEAMAQFDMEYLKKALAANLYDKEKTAKKIGLARETLQRKISGLEI